MSDIIQTLILIICLMPVYLGLAITTVLHWVLTVPLLLTASMFIREVPFKIFIERNVDITKSLWSDWK